MKLRLDHHFIMFKNLDNYLELLSVDERDEMYAKNYDVTVLCIIWNAVLVLSLS